MPENVTYYAMMLDGDLRDAPSGLARRSFLDNGGIRDEVFRRDSSWGQTPLIVSSERGDMTFALVEVSPDEAQRIIERLRARWDAEA
jgi:hypothetical protein